MIFQGTHEVDSPEWWANRLHKEMRDREIGRGWSQETLSNERGVRPPLKLLDAWRRNEPPLPSGGSQSWQREWSHVLRMTRTNAAELVVSSRTERIVPLGWTTAADSDADGDQKAEEIAKRNNLRTVVGEAIEDMLALGDGYLIATKSNGKARILRGTPFATITAERGGETIAALHLDHDTWRGVHEAWLFLAPREQGDRGALMIARKEKGGRYEWTSDGGSFPARHFPVTRLRNKDGVGEFERSLSDLTRINDSLFNRLVLTKLQAHRQRGLQRPALKGDDPEIDIEFDPADFETGPNALWDLPPGVSIWESAAADLTPVRSIVDDEFRILASTTKTPIWVMLPGSQNQSATGSEKADSAFLSLVADRQHRVDVALSRVLAAAFAIEGDEERADPTKIGTLWAPQERYSLTEKARAFAAAYGKMPFDKLATDVWQVPPSDLPALNAARGRDIFFQSPGGSGVGEA